MAKITFVHDEFRARLGVMYLSAAAKKKGHKADVCCNMGEKNIVKAVLRTKPDVIGLSTCTVEHKFALRFAEEIKRLSSSALILMGGPHATFYPEVVNNPAIDMVLRGEGDLALVELLDCIEQRQSYKHLSNLYVKSNGEVTKNQPRHLIEKLDDLPFPDRDIYYNRYPALAGNPTKTFMAMRGCPFLCSYCFNHAMIKLYKGKGNYVRLRDPEKFVQEIKMVKEKYGMKWVQVNDDTININKQWLYRLLNLYKKEINLPFICNVRVDFLDEDMVRRLKEAGCDRANFGIEHGNEGIRKTLLKRNTTNQQIVNAGRWFKKYKIRVVTTNITGLPREAISDFFETVEINRKVQPEYAHCSLLQPFPGTEIYEHVKSCGYLDPNFSVDDIQHPHSCFFSYRASGSAIKQKEMMNLVNLQKFFHMMVRYPWVTPVALALANLPHNRFFDFIYQLPTYRKYIKYAKDNRERWRHLKSLFRTLTG